tara:strand:+ start:310 stop:507 length:198 start_codon:yes stop_codon:yes gene_type:complete
MSKKPDIQQIVMEHIEANMFGTANEGVCLECGDVRDGCEPDAQNYECWECGEHAVAGMEIALMMV